MLHLSEMVATNTAPDVIVPKLLGVCAHAPAIADMVLTQRPPGT